MQSDLFCDVVNQVNLLIQAIVNEDLVQVQKLVIQNLINAPNAQGQTVLFSACRHGRTSTVRYLLTIPGINVNQQSGLQDSCYGCLHVAAENNFAEIIALLLYQGANPSVTDVFGRVPAQLGNSFSAVNDLYLKGRLTSAYPLVKTLDRELRSREDRKPEIMQDPNQPKIVQRAISSPSLTGPQIEREREKIQVKLREILKAQSELEVNEAERLRLEIVEKEAKERLHQLEQEKLARERASEYARLAIEKALMEDEEAERLEEKRLEIERIKNFEALRVEALQEAREQLEQQALEEANEAKLGMQKRETIRVEKEKLEKLRACEAEMLRLEAERAEKTFERLRKEKRTEKKKLEALEAKKRGEIEVAEEVRKLLYTETVLGSLINEFQTADVRTDHAEEASKTPSPKKTRDTHAHEIAPTQSHHRRKKV